MSDAMSQAASWKAERLEQAEAKYGGLSDDDLSAEWDRLSKTIKILEGMRDQLDTQIDPLKSALAQVQALGFERRKRARWGSTT